MADLPSNDMSELTTVVATPADAAAFANADHNYSNSANNGSEASTVPK